MGKILIIVSVVITLLTAVLGVVNKGKLSDATTRATNAETDAKKKGDDLTKSKADLATTKKTLDDATKEKDTLTASLATATSDADKAKKDATDAQALLTTATTDKATLQASYDDVKGKYDALVASGTNPTQGPAPDQDLKTRLEEATTLVTKLQQENTDAKAKLATLEGQIHIQQGIAIKQGTEGRILAVNPAWNFVVLSLGDKQGVANNTELLVKRGGQLVGKIRVTSVEPSSSIADIVANSVPHGTVISPGDHVIYQKAQE